MWILNCTVEKKWLLLIKIRNITVSLFVAISAAFVFCLFILCCSSGGHFSKRKYRHRSNYIRCLLTLPSIFVLQIHKLHKFIFTPLTNFAHNSVSNLIAEIFFGPLYPFMLIFLRAQLLEGAGAAVNTNGHQAFLCCIC